MTSMMPWERPGSKVDDRHLQRLAVIYIRQSTRQQLVDHQESTRLQYALVDRAVALGWQADRILVIDEDLGKSGSSAVARTGFQRLVTEIGLDHVGLVLGIEMSRLARSGKDWYQLIELCALSGAVLADTDGVYDPAEYCIADRRTVTQGALPMPDISPASSDPASTAIPAGTYAVDTEQSTVTFRAKAFGLMWVRGRIPVREGSITISDGRITGTGLLDADRIDTALDPRDWHLRSAHCLHTNKHPTIRVAIDGADLSSHSVPCEVTVRGTTAPTQLQLRSIKEAGTLDITAETTVDRTVYPMLGPWAGVSRRANLTITLVARPTGNA